MFLYALLLAVCVAAVQLDPTLNYTVTLAGGKVSGCDPLKDMLSNRGCGTDNLQDLWNVDDGSGNQHYHFIPVPGLTDTFNVVTACQKYLSCQACSGDSTVDLFGVDDSSGRQRWLLTAVDGEPNTYTFQVAGGRDASCGIYMSTGNQCTDTFVDLFTSDDGSGRQRWVINPVQVLSAGSSSSTTSSSVTSSSASSSSVSSSSSASSSASSSSSSSSSTSSSGSSSSTNSLPPNSASGTASSGPPSFVTSSPGTASFPTSSSGPSSSSNSSDSFSPDSNSSSNSSSPKTNVGAIAGGVVGGIILLLLLAGILFFVHKRRNRDDGPSNATPYMLAQTTEVGAESFGPAMPPATMSETSNSTPSRTTEKGRRAGGVTAAGGRPGPGWDSSDSSNGRMSMATTFRTGTSSEAAELRNEVDNLRREMAEMRAQREYDMQPPPFYGSEQV